ncbi:AIM24 family protein [Aeromicrobium endophyticum]|uniref:AIM24 family protein n=1 Tax=Aeromicrobium endophyticum TaxID=2292704 RepID=A0A371NYQ2_9ACTN|nr:AIM24 family protein [Aeromicrobium endophyticum]REK68815.1 AIM24 family protein [Aeromicrobium endophyticum]
MKSDLFSQANLEVQTSERFTLQNPRMLKVTLGAPVLATKGVMVAYQGQVTFEHKSAGSIGKLMKKVVTSEDNPLMTVAGQGEVFFADTAKNVFVLNLEGDGITINGRNLLAFDASLDHDIRRVKGVGVAAGGLFNTVVNGTGQVALVADGDPMILDCSQQPTYVDINAAVCWSANLQPQLHNSMTMRSSLRGGSGEAFQYAFQGPGFVVVQPSEGPAYPQQGGGNGGNVAAAAVGGGILGGILS